MTQAAVSYQIRMLEERLGTSLFHRVGRKVALTDKGRALAPVITEAFDRMRSGFASLSAQESQVLTITTTSSMATLWLASRLGAFQMEHPDLAVRLDTSNDWRDFARDGIDVALRGGRGSWPGMDSRKLMPNRLAALCSPEFIARHGPITEAAQLHHLPRFSPDDIWWHEWFEAVGAPLTGGGGHRGLYLDSQAMEGRAAMTGQGVAIVSAFLWRAELEAGQLIEAFPSRVVIPMAYWLVYPSHTRNVPKVKAFRDWVTAEFERERALDPDGLFLPHEE